MKTPVARNGIRERRSLRVENFPKQRLSCLPPRCVRLSTLLFIMGFLVLEGLSWFANDANGNNTPHLQTTVAKKNTLVDKLNTSSFDVILQQHIMDAKMATIKASVSHITFWEPYMERSISTANEGLNNLMNVMSHCFARDVFVYRVEENDSYVLQPFLMHSNSVKMPPNQQIASHLTIPMAVFTPNFVQAAMDLFDPYNQGAFVTMFHDPVEVYLDQYIHQKGVVSADDNLLIRYLTGINDVNRKVNSDDYDIARQVLMSKFVIGSCDNSAETLTRLVKMIGSSDGTIGSGGCTKARQQWNQECRKRKRVGERKRNNRSYLQILRSITSTHQFDIQLYEESKNIFHEQSVLFR